MNCTYDCCCMHADNHTDLLMTLGFERVSDAIDGDIFVLRSAKVDPGLLWLTKSLLEQLHPAPSEA